MTKLGIGIIVWLGFASGTPGVVQADRTGVDAAYKRQAAARKVHEDALVEARGLMSGAGSALASRMLERAQALEPAITTQTTAPVLHSVGRFVFGSQAVKIDAARGRAFIKQTVNNGGRVEVATRRPNASAFVSYHAAPGDEGVSVRRVDRDMHHAYTFAGTAADVPAMLKGRVQPGTLIRLSTQQERTTIAENGSISTGRQPTLYRAWVGGLGTVPITRAEYLRLQAASAPAED